MCLTEIINHFVLYFNKHNWMSSTKIILASQGHSINQYKNLKSKSLRLKSNILMRLTEIINHFVLYFNKHNWMSSTKIILASQGHSINQYKNFKCNSSR